MIFFSVSHKYIILYYNSYQFELQFYILGIMNIQIVTICDVCGRKEP